MDIYLKVETTGLDADDEVIRWTANTYKGNVVTTGRVELEDRLYRPAFKRGWENVSQFNGITPEMVADKPSNVFLKKDLTNFFENMAKKYPNEQINVVMWDAKFVYEALAKTGFKLNKDINVVNLLEPMTVRIAYEDGEAWKDNPTLKNIQSAFQLYYNDNDNKTKGSALADIKTNPSKYLDVVKYIHKALQADLKMDKDAIMCRDAKGDYIPYSKLQEDKRVNINPMNIATLYSEEVLSPRPSKLKQRNYEFWNKHKKELEDKFKETYKQYSARLDKEMELVDVMDEPLPGVLDIRWGPNGVFDDKMPLPFSNVKSEHSSSKTLDSNPTLESSDNATVLDSNKSVDKTNVLNDNPTLESADKMYSVRMEKERVLQKEKELPFKVDSVKEFSDTKKGIVGFLIFVHDDDRQTSVFVSDKKMKELTGRFLLLPANISEADRKAEETRALRLAAIVFLENEKDIFKGKNNSLALSEAGLFCLDKAVSTHTDSSAIAIDVVEISKELHKPWTEISKDLKRDIRAEGLEDLVQIPAAEDEKGVIMVSPIVATKFFGKRWEEEKTVEAVVENQKENANRVLVIRNSCLCGMDLSGMDLSNAVLTGSDLSGANLSDTNLTGANLTGVKMDKDTKVINTNFTNAVIIGLQSEGTDFRKAVALNRAITSVNRLSPVQRKIVDDLEKTR